MPSRRAGSGQPKPFFAAWRDQLPGVAASLTTAVILFAASLSFAPVRHWLFAQDVATYPLICTADPVAGPNGRRIVEFYIINRSRDNFSGEQLQQALDTALRGSGSSASAAITLPLEDQAGRIERVVADEAFNRGKGELRARIDGQSVRIDVGEIHGGAILRVLVVVAGLPDVGPVSRDAKLAVPFDYLGMQESCYTRG